MINLGFFLRYFLNWAPGLSSLWLEFPVSETTASYEFWRDFAGKGVLNVLGVLELWVCHPYTWL